MTPPYVLLAFGALIALSCIIPSIFASSLVKRDEIIPATLPGSWTSLGCYTDVGRTLNGGFYESLTNMTIESCIGYCRTNGYLYAGTEYSSQCFCGNNIASNAVQSPSSCHMTCSGDHTEACGDASKMNVFFSGQTGPQTNPGPGFWSLVGCYTEGKTGRTLSSGVVPQGGIDGFTIGTCTSACQKAGFVLAGAEYGQECWCGNAIANGGSLAPGGLTECDVLCKGNASEFCGGPSRLEVYYFNGTYIAPTGSSTTSVMPSPVPKTPGNYTYYGCQTEGQGVRALAGKGTISSFMSIEACEAFCFGYTYFGTEYGQECYCGNFFGTGSLARPDSECSFLCPGNIGQYCGASNRLSVYIRNGTVSPSLSSNLTVTPATLPTGWTYQGCWVDGTSGRILTGQQFTDSPQLTIESCVNACAGLGYSIAGTEYSSQCFCDNHIENSGVKAVSETDCAMKCSGNDIEICGGPSRISIYASGEALILNPAPGV